MEISKVTVGLMSVPRYVISILIGSVSILYLNTVPHQSETWTANTFVWKSRFDQSVSLLLARTYLVLSITKAWLYGTKDKEVCFCIRQERGSVETVKGSDYFRASTLCFFNCWFLYRNSHPFWNSDNTFHVWLSCLYHAELCLLQRRFLISSCS